jgi:hypothetical protein
MVRLLAAAGLPSGGSGHRTHKTRKQNIQNKKTNIEKTNTEASKQTALNTVVFKVSDLASHSPFNYVRCDLLQIMIRPVYHPRKWYRR